MIRVSTVVYCQRGFEADTNAHFSVFFYGGNVLDDTAETVPTLYNRSLWRRESLLGICERFCQQLGFLRSPFACAPLLAGF